MARTKDPKLEARRKATIADATIELLASESWRSVTLRSVAKHAGVSKGVVTYWFPTKDQLILEAVRRFHERYESSLMEIALSDKPIAERMRQLIDTAFPSQDDVREEVRFHVELWSYAKENPEMMIAVRDAYTSFRMATEAMLRLGAEQGYVNSPHIDGMFRFVHALIDGLSLHLAYEADVDLPSVRKQLHVLLEVWFQVDATPA